MKKLFTIIMFLTSLIVISAQPNIFWRETWEENWIDNWYASNGVWEVGTPVSGPDTAYEGTKCLATILSGNYTDGTESRLIKINKFTVPSDNPVIRFWHWYQFGSGDYGEVQVKETGKTTWDIISDRYLNNASNTWTYPLIDLSAYAGKEIQLCFFFHSQDDSYYDDSGPGWYVDDITILTGVRTFSNQEDFESGIGNWSVSTGTWEVGSPSTGPGKAYGGSACLATVLNGNYYESNDTRFISPSFQVSSDNPAIRFWHWYQFGSGDYGEVQVKETDKTTWDIVSDRYFNNGSNIWTYPMIDLSAYAGKEIQICFFFHSQDDSYYDDSGAGWYIDDILIKGFIIPVELILFTASEEANKIKLEWITASEKNNKGFDIERSEDGTFFIKTGYIEGYGTTTKQHKYSFIDQTKPGKYYYRLKQMDFDGTFSFSYVISVELNNIPGKFCLLQNNPNPFNPTTTITYSLPGREFVTLSIFNSLGEKVSEPVNDIREAGIHKIIFSPDNLSSGIYFYRISAGKYTETKKMIIQR